MNRLRHIALFVPNLQEAEQYYRDLFQMEMICREAPGADGQWYQLPEGKTWADAKAAGIELRMIGMRNEEFVLACFPGKPQPGQIFAIGLSMDKAHIAAIRQQLSDGTLILEEGSERLTFRDRYDVNWQLTTPGRAFRGNGEAAGRWFTL